MKINYLKMPGLCGPGILLLLLMAGCTRTTPPTPFVNSMSAQVGSHIFTATQVDGIYSRTLGLMGVIGTGMTGKDSTKLLLEFPYIPRRSHPFSSDTTKTSVSYFSGREIFTAFVHNGRILVSLSAADTVKHTFAGAFSGILYNPYNLKDSEVVNGKFNSAYTVYP
ncbi:MAG TPA: hypothetical protein VHE54_03730 [Puia sp.]|nr:hypothetical protein [Puia sp.]